jgi:hypothetical protein
VKASGDPVSPAMAMAEPRSFPGPFWYAWLPNAGRDPGWISIVATRQVVASNPAV